MIEGFHVDDSTYRAGVGWDPAGSAVKQIVGPLPGRRTGLSDRGLTCAAYGRAVVKSSDPDQFSRSRCLSDLANGRSLRSRHS